MRLRALALAACAIALHVALAPGAAAHSDDGDLNACGSGSQVNVLAIPINLAPQVLDCGD